MAETTIFMKVENAGLANEVKGESTSGGDPKLPENQGKPTYWEWIWLNSVDYSVRRDPTTSGATSTGGTSSTRGSGGTRSGSGSGARADAPSVTITKEVDLSTCSLIELVSTSAETNIGKITIDVGAPVTADGRITPYLQYVLSDCRVEDYEIDVGEDGTAEETVKIKCKRMLVRFWSLSHERIGEQAPVSEVDYAFVEDTQGSSS